MKLAIAQLSTQAGDLTVTCKKMRAAIERSTQQQADLVLFPVGALSGLGPASPVDAEWFFADCMRVLEELSEQRACPAIVPLIGSFSRAQSISLFLLNNGHVIPLYPNMLSELRHGMQHTSVQNSDGSFMSPRSLFAPSQPVHINYQNMDFTFAFDYADLEDLLEDNRQQDVVLYFSRYSYAVDDPSSAMGAALQDNRYMHDAEQLKSWFVGVNSLGLYDDEVSVGASFVINPEAQLVAQAKVLAEDLMFFEIPTHQTRDTAQLRDAFSAEDTPQTVDATQSTDPSQITGASHTREKSQAKDVSQTENDDLDATAKHNTQASEPMYQTPFAYNAPQLTWDALRFGISHMIERQHKKEALVVLDGSVQSFAVATLASDALGPTHVHALVVRTPDKKLNTQVAQFCQLMHLHVINDAYEDDAYARSNGKAPVFKATGYPSTDHALFDASLKARELDAVLLGNRDKTSYALDVARRYLTPDIMPFGDIYRSDLIALVHMRNTVSPVIPADALVLTSGPLDILMQEFDDPEKRLYFVDRVLSNYLEWNHHITELVEDFGHPDAVVAIITQLRDLDESRCESSLMVHISSNPLEQMRQARGFMWRDRLRDTTDPFENFEPPYDTDSEDAFEDDKPSFDEFAEMLQQFLQQAAPQQDVQAATTHAISFSESPTSDPAHARELQDLISCVRDFSAGGPFFGDGLDFASDASTPQSPNNSPSQERGRYWHSPFSKN